MAKRGKKSPAQRRQAKRGTLRFVGRVVRTLVVVSLLSGSTYAFCRYLKESDHYMVEAIRVEGNVILDWEAIVAQSELTCEDNILLLKSREVAERVETLPYVKECAVTRIFPNLVVIEVEERVAAGTLLVHNHTFEIDADRVVLRELPPDAEYPDPLVTSVPGLDVVAPGDILEQPALREALRAWNAFVNISVAREVTVSEMAALHENDIRMYCEELPYEIRWGRGAFDNQARRFDILWRTQDGCLDCKEYLDLRFESDLACK